MVVSCDPRSDGLTAATWAMTLNLPWVDDLSTVMGFTHALVQTEMHLEVRELSRHAPGPLYVDFVDGINAYRRQRSGALNHALARACGLKGGHPLTVIDATAGLGHDAFTLAFLGATVQMVERTPILAALLHDGLRRLADVQYGAPFETDRLRLIRADAREYLSDLRQLPPDQWPDVVYLDPMYPHRTKCALSKKDIRIVRHLVGDDDDAPELLAAALTCTRQRVVVKRPSWAPPLEGPSPHHAIVMPKTRFDVYLPVRPSLHLERNSRCLLLTH